MRPRSYWTAACTPLLCCAAVAAGAEPPATGHGDRTDGSAYHVHAPDDVLAGGGEHFLTDRAFETGIQLAAWEEPAPPELLQIADPSPPDGTADSIGAEPLSRIEWPDSDTGVDAGDTLRGIAEGTGLILAIAVVGLWALRQWLVKRTTIPGAGRNLRRIDSLSLPQRCHVHLLDVQGRRVLVAIDPAGVKGVTVLPDSFDSLIEQPPDETTAHAENTRHRAMAMNEPTFA